MYTTHAAVIGAEEEDLEPAWRGAHAALSRLARERCAADAEEGRWLLRAQRAAAHVYLGFGSFHEYIERLFGYQPRSTREKLRVAEALERLPALSEALQTGELSWSAVRELTRVAVRGNEQHWLELGRGKTVRQLEELVAGKSPGDDPESPSNPCAQRRVLRFEVEAETFATFREAIAELRRRSGGFMDDDSALLEMARQVLAGSRDEGRSSYRVLLRVCPACGAGGQLAGGEIVPVEPEIVGMARCDAQHLPHIDAQSTSANENGRAQGAAHVGTAPTRARQSIPPALRRAVLLRDHHRCRVPGCRHATFVDLHHIRPRAEGGSHTPENLVTVCGSHHRALHRGELMIEGTSLSAVFRHSDGREYGRQLDHSAAEAKTKLFQALRGLGFREGEVRAVLDELRQDVTLTGAPLEQQLREALVRIYRHG